MRTISHPASASSMVWRTVAAISSVSVVVIDWIRTGFSPPVWMFPMETARVFRLVG